MQIQTERYSVQTYYIVMKASRRSVFTILCVFRCSSICYALTVHARIHTKRNVDEFNSNCNKYHVYYYHVTCRQLFMFCNFAPKERNSREKCIQTNDWAQLIHRIYILNNVAKYVVGHVHHDERRIEVWRTHERRIISTANAKPTCVLEYNK